MYISIYIVNIKYTNILYYYYKNIYIYNNWFFYLSKYLFERIKLKYFQTIYFIEI